MDISEALGNWVNIVVTIFENMFVYEQIQQ